MVETERILTSRIEGQREAFDAHISFTDRRIERVEGRMWPSSVAMRSPSADGGVNVPSMPPLVAHRLPMSPLPHRLPLPEMPRPPHGMAVPREMENDPTVSESPPPRHIPPADVPLIQPRVQVPLP